MRLNSTLTGATAVAAHGGLLSGFDTAIVSGAQTQLKEIFQLDGLMRGFMVSGMASGPGSGWKVGQK